MKKVNIREALLDMDKQTYCQYDLYTLYEACNLQECDKKEIAKMISDDKSPEEIYDKLVDKFSDSVTTTDDDDISDVKESFGDDLIDSQYQDDTSDGHWSWDYDDDELANIYGGDTKYDNHPDGIEESQSLAEYWYFTKHGVQPGSIPNNIDILEIKDTPNGTYFKGNRVLTTKELQDYEIKEKSPEMKESVAHEYKMVESTDNGWVKRWNFLDNYYKGDLVISKISSPVDAWHVEKVAPNGHTIKHLGNYKSLEVAMDAAEKYLMKNESKSIKQEYFVGDNESDTIQEAKSEVELAIRKEIRDALSCVASILQDSDNFSELARICNPRLVWYSKQRGKDTVEGTVYFKHIGASFDTDTVVNYINTHPEWNRYVEASRFDVRISATPSERAKGLSIVVSAKDGYATTSPDSNRSDMSIDSLAVKPDFNVIEGVSGTKLESKLYDCLLQVNDSLRGGQKLSANSAVNKAYMYFKDYADDEGWKYSSKTIKVLLQYLINTEFSWESPDHEVSGFYESKSIKESSSGPKYVTRDIVNKTNSQKLKDAYDKGELEVLINGDVWYTERCPNGLGKELKAEMKRLYPDIRHLYGESVESELDTLNESTPLKKVETAVKKLGGRVINTEPENNLVEICSPSETLDDEWISQLKSEIDNIDSIDSVDIDEQTFYKYQRDTYSGKWEHIPYDGYNVFISPTHNRNIPPKELSKETTLDEAIDGWDNRTGVIKRIDKYLYDNPEAIPPKGYIQPGSRAYDDAVSRYGDYVTTPFGNISTDDLMQYARDNKLLDESKYTSNLIGPDNLLMNAEEAYFDDNLGDFVADTLNDGSATEEELLAVTEKSSFIEYDDMLNAIDYAKSLNESFDISWNGNKIATSANKNLCESIVKKALKASSTPDVVIESAGKNVTNKFIRSIVESQDIREGTSLKRIARYNEFDNGNVLHNYEKMTSEEAEEKAKQASIDNPDDIYYVAYDDIMNSSSDLRWINGKSYNYSDVQIKGGKPYIKDASANESIEDTSIEDIDKFVAEVKEKFPGSEAIYDGDTNTIKITLDNVQKENLTEDSTEFDELETADQKISSANTSINSSKLPAIFRLVKFEPDTLNLDYGGGKFDNAAEYLAQQNVTNLVYDPYNRSTQHNAEVLQKVRENGGADTVTISNVLNVIAEPEARLTVLRNAKKLVKPGGNVYITVYEGNKSGEGTETKSGYQLNKGTADYIDEISSVFSTVNRKGKLIIAK